MIQSLNSSGWMFLLSKSCRVYWRRDNDENPGKCVHSTSITSPSFCCSWTVFHLSNTWNGISADTYFCLRPFDRLITGWYRTRQGKMNIPDITNLNKLSISSIFCVLVDFTIRYRIGPKMDGGFHRRSHEHNQINTFVLSAVGCRHSQLLLRKLKDLAHVPTLRVFHVFSILVVTLQVSLSLWSWNIYSHHFLIGFVLHQFPGCQRNNLLSTSLEKIRLLNLSRVAPVSWMLVRLLFFHRHSPNWPEIPNFVKRFPHSFARAPPDIVSLSPSESLHSKPSSDLSLTPDHQKENHKKSE